MTKQLIHFIGFIANTDESTRDISLEHGFKLSIMSDNEAIKLMAKLECLPSKREILSKLNMDYQCLFDKRVIVITNSLECDIKMNKDGYLLNIPSEVVKFDSNMIDKYLTKIFSLMRLFKDGNIYLPAKYYYFNDDGTLKSFMRSKTNMFLSPDRYKLTSTELSQLQEFIKQTEFPFKYSYLNLAFDNYEWSYHVRNLSLSFLSLMISIETLFHPSDQQELSYRISRNVAVLLGKRKEESERIYSNMRELYGKRSKIVHTGALNIVNKENLKQLRHYVRESIKEIIKIDKRKDDLLKLLHSSGFGR